MFNFENINFAETSKLFERKKRLMRLPEWRKKDVGKERRIKNIKLNKQHEGPFV